MSIKREESLVQESGDLWGYEIRLGYICYFQDLEPQI